MCGIAGAFFGPTEQCTDIVQTMVTLQRHRGPDSERVETQPWFSLGHTRLAINALGPPGDQPMRSASGRWLVVFNGEIYNHEDIRRRRGWSSLGPGDGQVIPSLLQEDGPAGLSELRGMFAICAVDLLERSVLLAVDPLGIKPLHWARSGGLLLVASEAKALADALPQVTVDPASLATYLNRGALDNSQTGIAEIERVRPGCWLLLQAAGMSSSGFTYDESEVLEPQTWRDVEQTFDESVRRHLMSDVPVSVLMSDGVDSGALGVMLARNGADVTALTVDLGGGRRSEVSGAAQLCRELGIKHKLVRRFPGGEDIDAFFSSMQRPSIDGINTFIVCKAVAEQGFKVAMSGMGGDEFLTAYTTRGALALSRGLSLIPAPISARLVRASRPGVSLREVQGRLASMPGGRMPASPDDFISLQRQIWTADHVFKLIGVRPSTWTPNNFVTGIGPPSTANTASAAQVGLYLTSQLLPDADAYSMAHGVELRVPFVDVEFARAALNVRNSKLSKKPFVAAIGDRALTEASRRPKQGFSLPMEAWMRDGLLRDRVVSLEDSGAPVRSLIDPESIDKTLRRWREGTVGWPRMWSLVALNEWLDGLHNY